MNIAIDLECIMCGEQIESKQRTGEPTSFLIYPCKNCIGVNSPKNVDEKIGKNENE